MKREHRIPLSFTKPRKEKNQRTKTTNLNEFILNEKYD